ncbi:hypothetical protein BOTU111921_03315 [Bordetella tumbae]|uniref:hypothetical protein n=1 Tax=Bordetella tumbae TaxID=1649139 RepID=UPI0039F0E72D
MALDPQTQTQVLAAVHHALTAMRTAALYISHDLPTMAGLADYLLVLRHGQVVESDQAAPLLADPQHPYTRQLFQAQAPTRTKLPSPAAQPAPCRLKAYR